MDSTRVSVWWASVRTVNQIASVVIVGGFMLLLVSNCRGADSAYPQLPAVANSSELTVAGVVFEDINGNGVADDADRALSGVTVTGGFGGENGQTYATEEATTVTSERGGFVIELPQNSGVRPRPIVQVELMVNGPSDDTQHPVQVWYDVSVGDTAVELAVVMPARCDQDEDASTVCGTALLPDLVPVVEGAPAGPDRPMPADSWLIDESTFPGRRLLRFSSLTANTGVGPLHMIAAAQPDGEELPTWQRIWTDQMRYHDTSAGAFVYHPGHDHIHLEGFEYYRLLTSDGDEAATGGKVSFCLRDSIQIQQTIRSGLLVLSGADCGVEQQAINVGFGDYYGADLPDQWIDITNVASGSYVVEIVVDPDNILQESDESNNRVTFDVSIPPG